MYEAQNWGYMSDRADIVPTLLKVMASLGSGLCTLLATGWKVSVIWISNFRIFEQSISKSWDNRVALLRKQEF